ncbi:ATP-dependent RNA helicase mrh4 [Penicillium atrosanguineum]|nr:ATP-dependent RNA helicase mrh4 [Penicillium atrosanguineum]
MPLPVRTSICFLCQTRATIALVPALLSTWQATRSMATMRRKASRLTLSPNVSKPTLNKPRSGRSRDGPFAGMNQKEARIRDTPRSRSQAALKRSGEEGKDEKKESPLYKALKMQTTLSPVPYARRTATKARLANFDSRSFPKLSLAWPKSRQLQFNDSRFPDCSRKMMAKRISLSRPARMPPQYEQYLLAAETGSGKTLAYLLPVVDAIKRAERVEKEEQEIIDAQKAKEREEKLKNRTFELEPEEPPMTDAGRPRAIILVPTSELVSQVGAKVKALAHGVKYRSGMIASTLTPRRIKNTLFHPDGIDILVSTPHLLSSIAKTNPYILSRVSHLVLDEADSLMDRSFLPTTMEVVDKVAPSLKKLIFCSATIPRSLDNQLRKKYPDVKRLTTPNLHAIPRRVQLGVVDIDKEPYRGNRSLACADVVWSIGKAGESSDGEDFGPLAKYMGPKVKKIIVFVNEREEADEVAQFLSSKGIDAVALSRDSSSRKQEEILAEFTEVDLPPTSDEISEVTRRLPNTKVLVTTDIASRGIDTLAVKTVVLYHVPHTTVDFIHRLGRLGRMGKRGRGVVLVGKKDRKDVVREVREGMFRGQALI